MRQHHFCALTLSPSDPTPPSVADTGASPGAAPNTADVAPTSADGTLAVETAGKEGFLQGTVSELSKVVWPSRQQLFSESVAVILMVGLSAAAIAALDRFLHWVSTNTFPIP